MTVTPSNVAPPAVVTFIPLPASIVSLPFAIEVPSSSVSVVPAVVVVPTSIRLAAVPLFPVTVTSSSFAPPTLSTISLPYLLIVSAPPTIVVSSRQVRGSHPTHLGIDLDRPGIIHGDAVERRVRITVAEHAGRTPGDSEHIAFIIERQDAAAVGSDGSLRPRVPASIPWVFLGRTNFHRAVIGDGHIDQLGADRSTAVVDIDLAAAAYIQRAAGDRRTVIKRQRGR